LARILHISCDFPDVLAANKTQAIKRLVDATPEYRHVVYSLNRVDGLSGVEVLEYAPDRLAIAYRAPPKGILLKTRLEAVAARILSDIAERKSAFDVVHAHKLTIDGIVGHSIALKLALPIVFSIQGDTDLKVVSARPDLKAVFARHVADAATLFPFAPWAAREVNRIFAGAEDKSRLLPVMPAKDELTAASPTGTAKLVSVFHLDSWRRKNLSGLARAVKLLSSRIPGVELDVYGSGSPNSFLEAREALAKAGAGSLVHLAGPIANAEITSRLKHYAAFVLPTLRESYGLVHAEALFAGLPVVYSQGMGIDGLLPQSDYLAGCDPRSPASIAAAMEKLVQSEAHAKQTLRQAQIRGDLDAIRCDAVLETYRAAVAQVLRRTKPFQQVENIHDVA
jgi:glycosyltransferase involved in cell wall biosynthesis